MITESTYENMTVEHLGSDATEGDLEAFQEQCERVLPRFNGDTQVATDYVWNNGDIRWTFDVYRIPNDGGIEIIACGECGSDEITVNYGASTSVTCHDCGMTSSEIL